jgi:hypothetical protein
LRYIEPGAQKGNKTVTVPKTKPKRRLPRKLDSIQKRGFNKATVGTPTVSRRRGAFPDLGGGEKRSGIFNPPKGQDNPLKRLLGTLSEVAERSHLTGQTVGVRIEIDPGGRIRIISEGEDDPRDLEPKRDPDLENALTAARERGQNRVAEILRGDDMLSADAFAALLGTSRVTVNAKRVTCQVLGLEGAKRGFRFPKWQIGQDGKPFSALPKLFDRLGDDPWAVYRFLVQHHPELDGLTGCEALRRGKTKQAIEAAESVARGPA